MGSRCRASKLTEDDVVEIRRLRAEGVSMKELAARFGVTYENVLAIFAGGRGSTCLVTEGRSPSPPAR